MLGLWHASAHTHTRKSMHAIARSAATQTANADMQPASGVMEAGRAGAEEDTAYVGGTDSLGTG